MADPGTFWRNYFANREVQRVLGQNGLGRFGTPPPTGAASMGASAPAPGGVLVPLGKEGARVGEGVVESALRPQNLVRAATPDGPAFVTKGVTPGMELVPLSVADDAAATVASTAGRTGLLAAARGQLGTLGETIAANGWKGGLLPAGIGIAGSMAGSALDESNLLGGSESKANDTASKALKWGSAGAGAGLMVGGPVGALIGGAGGAVVGVLHEGAERQGWLGTPTKQEQIDTLVHDAEANAAKVGLPPEVVGALKDQFNAGKQFAETKDEKLALAQQFAQQVQAQAMNYVADPSQYASAGQTDEAAQAQQMIQRSLMLSAIKPYADNFLARSSAEADAYQNMAKSEGNMAPLYEQMAAQTRASGARQAMEIVQQTQITPYQQALEKQASYLNQMSSNLVSQAMGQVGQTQPAAGSTDLTSIIDQYANSAQPA